MAVNVQSFDRVLFDRSGTVSTAVTGLMPPFDGEDLVENLNRYPNGDK